jgi:hypothetical protein
MLFSALVITSCIGFSALLNGLIADPVERLRSRLRTDARGADDGAQAPTAGGRQRPAAAAQPLGSIRRVP